MKSVFLNLLLVIAMVCVCAVIPVYAMEQPASIVQKGSLDITNWENDPNIEVSDPMSYEEMISRYAQNADISVETAKMMFPEKKQTYGTRDIHYREFREYLDVTNEYRPHISFFCETAEGGSTFNILNIYSVQLVRISENTLTGATISKQFSGDLQAWLRGVWKIEYVINGDFYNYGTTTVTGGMEVNAGINELVSIRFNVSSSTSSNHYAPFYKHRFIEYFNS